MATSERGGIGRWYAMLLGVALLLFGLPILGGGAYLMYLGGSWYYVFAGLGLFITAIYLFRQSMAAVSVYLFTYVGTLVWAFWEAGFDGWAQVPRLVAPTVVLILLLLAIPALGRERLDDRRRLRRA